MKHAAEQVQFESMDIRALSDDELDDIVGGGSTTKDITLPTVIGGPLPRRPN